MPFLQFSRSVPVCGQLSTYSLFGFVSLVFQICSCLWSAINVCFVVCRVSNFLDLFLSVVCYQRMYYLVPCLEFSRSVPVCGQLSTYILFGAVSSVFQICSCLWSAISVCIVWCLFSRFLDLFVSGVSYQRTYCLVPFVQFSRSVRVWGQLSTYVLFGAVSPVIQICSCLWSTINICMVWCRFSSFLDLFVSGVSYQRTYCLVPFLQFSRSVRVCGQLSTYVLFGAVSPVFQICYCLWSTINVCIVWCRFSSFLDLFVSGVSYQRTYCLVRIFWFRFSSFLDLFVSGVSYQRTYCLVPLSPVFQICSCLGSTSNVRIVWCRFSSFLDLFLSVVSCQRTSCLVPFLQFSRSVPVCGQLCIVWCRFSSFLDLSLSVVSYQRMYCLVPFLQFSRSFPVCGQLSTYVLFCAVSPFFQICSCLWSAINVCIVWCRFSSFLNLFVSGVSYQRTHCLVPFLQFSRSVRVWGWLSTHVLFGAVSPLFQICSCLWSGINVRIFWCRFSSFLDLFLSVVSYQRMYCLVPFLQFSRSVLVCGQLSTYVLFGAVSQIFQICSCLWSVINVCIVWCCFSNLLDLFLSVVSYQRMYCLVPFLKFSRSVPVCDQLSTYVLFGAVSQIFQICSCLWSVINVCIVCYRFSSFLNLFVSGVSYQRMYCLVPFLQFSRSVRVWGQLSTYLLFGAVSPVFQICSCLWSAINVRIVWCRFSSFLGLFLSVVSYQRMYCLVPFLQFSRFVRVWGQLSTYILFGAVSPVFQICSCLGLAINVRIVWCRFSSFLGLFLSVVSYQRVYCLVPFLQFSRSVGVWGQLSTYVLFGAVSTVFQICSCLGLAINVRIVWCRFSSFLDLFVSGVSYQRMYCLVPFLHFLDLFVSWVSFQRMYCLVPFLQFSRSFRVWGQLSTYVLFGAVSPVFQICSCLDLVINVCIVWCRFSSFLDLSLSVVSYQRMYCQVPFLQFSRSVPVWGQLSTYVLFGAVSPVFQICSCLWSAINVCIVWCRFSSFLDVFLFVVSYKRTYCLVPCLQFSRFVSVCGQLSTYVLFGAVSPVFQICSCLWSAINVCIVWCRFSSFLDLFLSMVSYQRMYCLVPCLEFSRSVPVCSQLLTYVLFDAVSPVFQICSCLWSVINVCIVQCRFSSFLDLFLSVVGYQRMYCLVPFLQFFFICSCLGLAMNVPIVWCRFSSFLDLFLSVVTYQRMYCFMPFLQFSRSVPVCGYLSRYVLFSAVSSVFQICPCLWSVINVCIIWCRFLCFLFCSCLWSAINVCIVQCRFLSFLFCSCLWSAISVCIVQCRFLSFLFCSCQWLAINVCIVQCRFSSFLDPFLSVVIYQGMYCLVPFLQFSRSVPVCGQLSTYVLFGAVSCVFYSVRVCGQLSAYVLFSVVS